MATVKETEKEKALFFCPTPKMMWFWDGAVSPNRPQCYPKHEKYTKIPKQIESCVRLCNGKYANVSVSESVCSFTKEKRNNDERTTMASR